MKDTIPRAAGLIRQAFEKYDADFNAISARTRHAFERRDWPEVQDAAVDRIDLYDRSVNQTRWQLPGVLDESVHLPSTWTTLRDAYANMVEDQIDRELYKTYFNSLSRRTFGTQGVDTSIEFVDVDDHPTRGVEPTRQIRRYSIGDDSKSVALTILSDFQLGRPYADADGCATFVGRRLEQTLRRIGQTAPEATLTLLEQVFFRGTRGFLVGRLDAPAGWRPVMIALAQRSDGIIVDAVIPSRSQVSMLFGFTRSYFHVDVEHVAPMVAFLSDLMPDKPVGEIYTVLGRAKQGKTERYRELIRHLECTDDRLVVAPGSKGMVMAVFVLASADLVFKVIRDRFAYPKTVVRQEVLDSYDLVFKHDRAGRLVDAQEFRRLKFPRARFEEPMLRELAEECAKSVTVTDSEVIVHHLYIERRIDPLNLYLRDLPDKQALPLMREYGQAIRDLAMSNIFPGDLLLKNFGVTRHGRVVFYDYDELCLVTDCNFRAIPQARHEAEELSAETWYTVGPNDIFPEQFQSFLGLPPPLLAEFKRLHGELLTPEYWREVKAELERGRVIDFPHYSPSRLAG